MRIKYDKETDILYISFIDTPVAESDEDKPGIILDYSAQGEIVGIEVLDASKKMPFPTKLEYEIS